MRRSDATVERFRILGEGFNGAFRIPYSRETYNPGKVSKTECYLAVICSNGCEGWEWDHVSVHVLDPETLKDIPRCPTWEEMVFVKGLFFQPSETVVQYHPPEKDYINRHRWTLHLWRPQKLEIPMPPKEMV